MDANARDQQDNWEIEATEGSHDAEIHSPTTGERIARVYSRDSGHADAPADETALGHAALFRAAPRLRDSLERILSSEEERLDPSAVKAARDLLNEIKAGPGEAFLKARAEEQRRYEEIIQAQILEMSTQSDVRELSAELEEEEALGHSL